MFRVEALDDGRPHLKLQGLGLRIVEPRPCTYTSQSHRQLHCTTNQLNMISFSRREHACHNAACNATQDPLSSRASNLGVQNLITMPYGTFPELPHHELQYTTFIGNCRSKLAFELPKQNSFPRPRWPTFVVATSLSALLIPKADPERKPIPSPKLTRNPNKAPFTRLLPLSFHASEGGADSSP